MSHRSALVRALCAALFVAASTAANTPGTPTAATPPAPTDAATGTIVARAAGDRDPATGFPAPLEGAKIRAYTDAALTQPAGECTTDATGTCTITGLTAGTYRVAPAADPPGGRFHRLEAVATSLDGVGPDVDTVSVGEGTPTTRRFVFRRSNPPFPAGCGVRLALVYDLSGSIDPAEAATMKAASLDFVDALAGTPSQMAVASFATDAPAAGNVDLAPTGVAGALGVTTVKGAIGALHLPDGDGRYTNWDAALRAIAGRSDVVVLFTDGSPTVHGVPAVFPPVVTAHEQLDAGVLSANAVKSAGARVVAVGVGDVDDVSRENLVAVSGPVEGSDYAITTFAEVGKVFRSLADALCPRPGPTEPAPAPSAPGPEPAPQSPRFTG